MEFKISVSTTFECSLERAFKTPMLSDVCKVHSGYGLTPKVTHCLDDASWGKPGGSRRVFMQKNIAFVGGEAALDTVIERKENGSLDNIINFPKSLQKYIKLFKKMNNE